MIAISIARSSRRWRWRATRSIARFDGEEGQFLGETEPYDAVVLDLGLPKLDGASIITSWRSAGKTMPILVLTARDRWSDKVNAFDAGADDYVTKPFHLEELLARVRALLASRHRACDERARLRARQARYPLGPRASSTARR